MTARPSGAAITVSAPFSSTVHPARIASANPCLACGLAFEIRPIEAEKACAFRESNETPLGGVQVQ